MAYQDFPPSNTGDPSPFYTRSKTLRRTLVSLSADRYLNIGPYPVGIAIAGRTFNQTVVSGGSILATATPVALTNNFVQTPKVIPWFCSFRAKITGAFAGANYSAVGISDGANDYARVGYEGGVSNSFFQIDVAHGGVSTTQVGTIALDTAVHDHAMYYDGSTALKYFVDGVLCATLSTLTNFPTTAQSLMAMANVTTLEPTELFYSYNETA